MTDTISAQRASFSIPSILAVVCAILAYTSSAGWALFAAIGAMAFGVIGILMSLAPSIRGGIMSIVSASLGALGVVVAILRLVF